MKIKAKKSFSQNWLKDEKVIEQMIEVAAIKKGEKVLEIGSGKGVLTQALIKAGAVVTAVEVDLELVDFLQREFGKKIKLIADDILTVDLAEIGLENRQYKIVANLPYHITSAILEKFLTTTVQPKQMVLMVQKEVAERIVAKPPQMSLLSVVCQIYAQVQKVIDVPAESFNPKPKVDSAVVLFDLKKQSQDFNLEKVIKLAKIGFLNKRKQLQRNLVSAGLGESKEIKSILQELNLNPQERAENLLIEDWIALNKKIK